MICLNAGCMRASRKRGRCDSHYQTAMRRGEIQKIKFPPRVQPEWTPIHTELAWAAGFLDGEGSFYVTKSQTTRSRVLPHVDIPQSDTDHEPYVLTRFQAAVGGFGRIDGPRHTGKKPAYKLQFSGYQQTQAILAMLWPWLSPIKRTQALRTLQRAQALGTLQGSLHV